MYKPSGEPPYSVGQASANDNNANLAYPTLDASIRDSYAKHSTATNKNSLYDSYIRAFRWATNRLADRGIMAFVSNGGWLDGNTADGMRLSLGRDFSELWIFNLRGNQRTAGELSRKEGGKIFGSGSRNTVAITIGVKNPAHSGPATIHYRDIGDYLDRDTKLDILTAATLHDHDAWNPIHPNPQGDWLNQRDTTFENYLPVGVKDGGEAIFAVSSNGLKTNRDAWCYNFSTGSLRENVEGMIAAFNEGLGGERVVDPSRISWSGGLVSDHERSRRQAFRPGALRHALYRPFTREIAYFDRSVNERVYRMPTIFPTADSPNVGFLVIEPTQRTPFSVLATDLLPDSKTYVDAAQFFPRWIYEPGAKRGEPDGLFEEDGDLIDGYRRVDNITDTAQAAYREAFGPDVSKDDIFAYVYAVLHSPHYRQRFAADLKKMLPRIPLAADTADFRAFVTAGQQLMRLHIDYESVEPYPLEEQVTPAAGLDDYALFAVTDKKMKFASKTDTSTLMFNPHVTLRGIPSEAHAYQLGSRSALEWIIDRYYIKTDKASGIVNDPNAWSREHGDPRYIIDLVKRVISVSVETMHIVGALPLLPLQRDGGTA